MNTPVNGQAQTGPGIAARPVAVADPLPLFPLSEDQAIERLIELDQREARTGLDVAIGMGDIVCQFVRPSDAVDPKGTLKRLAEASGIAESTLRFRGLVCERLSRSVRDHPNFSTNSFSVYAEIAQCPDVSERDRLFAKILTEQSPAPRGRWRVNDVREELGRSKTTDWTTIPDLSRSVRTASLEDRQKLLLELTQDPDVFNTLVNAREGTPAGISPLEQAFFAARANYVVSTVERLQNARDEARRVQEQSTMDMPSLVNTGFLGNAARRIETDAVRYNAFAGDLRSPALQQLGTWVGQLREPFQILQAAIERCLAELPDAPEPYEDAPTIIDAEAREAVERLALPGFIIDVDLP
jgi:hypothetical protein